MATKKKAKAEEVGARGPGSRREEPSRTKSSTLTSTTRTSKLTTLEDDDDDIVDVADVDDEDEDEEAGRRDPDPVARRGGREVRRGRRRGGRGGARRRGRRGQPRRDPQGAPRRRGRARGRGSDRPGGQDRGQRAGPAQAARRVRVPLLLPREAPQSAGRQEEDALPGLCLRTVTPTAGTQKGPLRRTFDRVSWLRLAWRCR